MDEQIDPGAVKQISLEGDPISLEFIEGIFKEPRCRVDIKLHGNGSCMKEYLLTSDLFSDLDNIKSIKKAADELIDEINSIFSFVKDGFRPISSGIIYIDECGYSFHEDHVSLRDNLYIIKNGKKIDIDAQRILELSALMKSDDLLKSILTILYHKGRDWVNLYRILEMFKAQKIDVVKKGWISHGKYSLFTQTANSFNAIGIEARHIIEYTNPPKKPMPLAEAQNIILNIIQKYISER